MKKNFLIFGIFILIAILQQSFLTVFFPENAVPNLLLLLIILTAIAYGFEKMFVWIVLLGLLADIYFLHPVGLSVLIFSSMAFISDSIAKRFSITHSNWRFMMTAVLVLLGIMIYYFFSNLIVNSAEILNSHGRLIFYFFSWKILSYQLAANFLMLLLIYNPLIKLEKSGLLFSKN